MGYYVQFWAPWFRKDINKMECIWRRAIREAVSLKFMPGKDWWMEMGLVSWRREDSKEM